MQYIQHMTKTFVQKGQLFNEAQVNQGLSDMNDEAQAEMHRNIDEEQPLQKKIDLIEPLPRTFSVPCADTKSETSRSKKSQDEDWMSPDNSRRNRKITKQKNNYPTKNFLQTFKPFILAYLRLHYTDYHSHPLIRKLTSKKSINMQDFQDIFCDPRLRPVLKDYFLNKNIYRDLMQTRINYLRKKQYFKRIQAIEQAYKTQKFEAINKQMLQSS